MYLGIFNRDTRIHNQLSAHRHPISGLLSGKHHGALIMLCMIGATLFLPFNFVFLVLKCC
jgi:hypothetical protein